MSAYRDITRAVVRCEVCGVAYYPDNGDVCECPEDLTRDLDNAEVTIDATDD